MMPPIEVIEDDIMQCPTQVPTEDGYYCIGVADDCCYFTVVLLRWAGRRASVYHHGDLYDHRVEDGKYHWGPKIVFREPGWDEPTT